MKITSGIVDGFGRPFEREVLTDDGQTAEIAYVPSRLDNHPGHRITPAKTYAILKAAERGDLATQAALFRDIEEQNPHIFSALDLRKRVVLTRDWSIEPPENADAKSKSATDFCREWIESVTDIEDIILDQTDAVGYGFATHELKWGLLDGKHVIESFLWRPQEWFRVRQQDGTMATVPRGDRSDLRLIDASVEGAELRPFGWMVHTHKSKSGWLDRVPLMRVLAILHPFMHFAITDWSEFLEIYGVPPRIAKYDPNSPTAKSDKAALARAVRMMGHDAGGVITKDMEIELLEAAKGDADAHERFIRLTHELVDRVVLGRQRVASGNMGGGSGVNEQNNETVRDDLTVADCRQMAQTWMRDALWPVSALNFGITDMRQCPRFVFNTRRPAKLSELGSGIAALQRVGLKVSAKWAREQSQVPEPIDENDVLEVAQPEGEDEREIPPKSGRTEPKKEPPKQASKKPKKPAEKDRDDDKKAALTALVLASLSQGKLGPVRDEMDVAVDAALDGWQPMVEDALSGLMQALKTAVSEGKTVAEFQQMLPELLAKTSFDELANRLALGQFLSNLTGQSNLMKDDEIGNV